jgi:hypothetical protein
MTETQQPSELQKLEQEYAFHTGNIGHLSVLIEMNKKTLQDHIEKAEACQLKAKQIEESKEQKSA